MNTQEFWMTGNRDGSCAECDDTFNKGDRIVWDPVKYKAYCKNCGSEMIGDDPQMPDKDKKEALEHARSKQKGRSQEKSKKKEKGRS